MEEIEIVAENVFKYFHVKPLTGKAVFTWKVVVSQNTLVEFWKHELAIDLRETLIPGAHSNALLLIQKTCLTLSHLSSSQVLKNVAKMMQVVFLLFENF